ncbi:heterokaryon incompatibility protein-domain-containing protein [Immersiella caudata]|uniref:Heterokaryon incompatibility protein-domain-containing protein n=1 Tax=Immersiella caudata TaxID=314043 RepID=A0AA40BZR6_9PEZI|nr:heterokaryon incompatibility protein-domain-containing protein [Immersiella caudata]
MFSTYQYHPLEAGAIRVLILEPAADLDAPIRCELEHVSCKDGVPPDPGYDALSYVWGPPAEGARLSIECDSAEIEVRFSCDSALRHLRRADVPVRLWVDAVCIDQGNDKEKEVQVARMSQVYTSARRVFIFLGVGVGDVADLFAWMPKAGPLIRSHEEEESTSDFLENEAGQQLAREARDRFEMHFELLLHLVRHDWVKRMWTLQELVAAGEPIVQCGRHVVPWVDFGPGLSFLYDQRAPTDDVMPELIKVRGNPPVYGRWDEFLSRRGFPVRGSITDKENADIAKARAMVSGTWSETNFWKFIERETVVAQYRKYLRLALETTKGTPAFTHLGTIVALNLLRLSQVLDATVLSDKIYGMYHLLSFVSPLPEVSYRLGEAEVFAESTRHIVRMVQGPGLILLSGTHPRRQGGDLPSWVPDWGACVDEVPYQLRFEFHRVVETTTRQPVATIEQSNGRRIALKGTVLTSVAARASCTWVDALATAWDHKCLDGPTISVLVNWLTFMHSTPPCPEQPPIEVAGSTILDILWNQVLKNTVEGNKAVDLVKWVIKQMDSGAIDAGTTPAEYCEKWHPNHSSSLWAGALMPMVGCVLFTDEGNRLFLCRRADVVVGDVVALFAGSSTPALLRRVGDDYLFLGPVYIHGIPYGVDLWEQGTDVAVLDTFFLI